MPTYWCPDLYPIKLENTEPHVSFLPKYSNYFIDNSQQLPITDLDRITNQNTLTNRQIVLQLTDNGDTIQNSHSVMQVTSFEYPYPIYCTSTDPAIVDRTNCAFECDIEHYLQEALVQSFLSSAFTLADKSVITCTAAEWHKCENQICNDKWSRIASEYAQWLQDTHYTQLPLPDQKQEKQLFSVIGTDSQLT